MDFHYISSHFFSEARLGADCSRGSKGGMGLSEAFFVNGRVHEGCVCTHFFSALSDSDRGSHTHVKRVFFSAGEFDFHYKRN